MKNIERIIESQYPPRQTNVAWKDVNENTLKFYVDGEWRALKDEDFRQKQADWNQADNTKADFIKNKPTIPDAQIQSDWNQDDSSKADYIKNKPTISSNVATIDATYNSSEQKFEVADRAVLFNNASAGKVTYLHYDTSRYALVISASSTGGCYAINSQGSICEIID